MQNQEKKNRHFFLKSTKLIDRIFSDEKIQGKVEYNDYYQDIKATMNFYDFNRIYDQLRRLINSIESRNHEQRSVFNPFKDKLENGRTLVNLIESKYKVKI